MGNPGWEWKIMANYYKKFHTLTKPSNQACEFFRLDYIDEEVRAKNGPVQASFPDTLMENPLPTAWVDALKHLGYPASGDPFSGKMFGGYINALSVDPTTKTRSSSVTAYLAPARHRKNLHVSTGSLVEKIVFDTSGSDVRATSVQYQKDGKTQTIQVGKEVILPAGTFGSPKLLELSGIGFSALLEKLSIPVIIDNPNVGENLQDHPNASIGYELVEGVPSNDNILRQNPEALQAAMEAHMTKQSGPFTVGGNFAGSLLPVHDFVGPNGKETLEQLIKTIEDATPGPFSPDHAAFVHSILANPTEGAGNLY
jgi:choline dehydrogenase-like flavoprotein